MSAGASDRDVVAGAGRLRELDLASALDPIAPHLASLRRRLAAIARRLPPEAAPPPERSIDPRG